MREAKGVQLVFLASTRSNRIPSRAALATKPLSSGQPTSAASAVARLVHDAMKEGGSQPYLLLHIDVQPPDHR